MAFNFKSLEPRIYSILRAPDVDFDSISAKRVRNNLIEYTPELEQEIKAHKKDIDELIIVAFHQVREEKQPVQDAAAPVKRKRSPDYEGAGTPTTSQPVPLQALKKELTDEELARQLDREINSGRSGRTTRNGVIKPRKGRSSQAKGKSASRGGAKSAQYVGESDDSDLEGGSDEDGGESEGYKEEKKPRKRAKKEDQDEEGKPAKKRRSGGGFNKPWALSDELAIVCGGEKVLSRPQVVKKIWEYIRAKCVADGNLVAEMLKGVKFDSELQNPTNKTKIKCDQALIDVFGVKNVTAFSMNKYIGKHLYETDVQLDLVDDDDEEDEEEVS